MTKISRVSLTKQAFLVKVPSNGHTNLLEAEWLIRPSRPNSDQEWPCVSQCEEIYGKKNTHYKLDLGTWHRETKHNKWLGYGGENYAGGWSEMWKKKKKKTEFCLFGYFILFFLFTSLISRLRSFPHHTLVICYVLFHDARFPDRFWCVWNRMPDYFASARRTYKSLACWNLCTITLLLLWPDTWQHIGALQKY